jgi:hypothetical protein
LIEIPALEKLRQPKDTKDTDAAECAAGYFDRMCNQHSLPTLGKKPDHTKNGV